MTPAATKLIATITLSFIFSSSISYFNYSLLKLAELEASVTRKYDKCHKRFYLKESRNITQQNTNTKEFIVTSVKVISNLDYNVN